jgi:hypothetical protein
VQSQQERLKAEASAASYAKLIKQRAKPQAIPVADEGDCNAPASESSKSVSSDSRELAQANAKLSELRVAFDKLKVEATRMHKALVRECGEDVPIDRILSGNPFRIFFESLRISFRIHQFASNFSHRSFSTPILLHYALSPS